MQKFSGLRFGFTVSTLIKIVLSCRPMSYLGGYDDQMHQCFIYIIYMYILFNFKHFLSSSCLFLSLSIHINTSYVSLFRLNVVQVCVYVQNTHTHIVCCHVYHINMLCFINSILLINLHIFTVKWVCAVHLIDMYFSA